MKPGKPLAFGRIKEKPIFGLPGNPVSSFVSFEQFVRPAIRKMTGCKDLAAQTVQATLTRGVSKKPGRLNFLSSNVSWENGECLVTPEAEQGSGILKSTLNANGLVVFPLEASELSKGERVTVQMLS